MRCYLGAARASPALRMRLFVVKSTVMAARCTVLAPRTQRRTMGAVRPARGLWTNGAFPASKGFVGVPAHLEQDLALPRISACMPVG